MRARKPGPALAALVALSFAAALAGCGGPDEPQTTGQVNLNLATAPSSVAAAKSGARMSIGGSEVFVLYGDSLVVSRVELVMREIEFKALGVEGACDSLTGDDSCHELAVGPMVVDLPLGDGVARQISVAVEPGTYSEIDFEIHKPEHDPGDDAFLAAHPDLRGLSVRVTGTFNRQAFVYTTDVTAEQEQDLAVPVEVAPGSNVDVTLAVDLGRWFLDSPGTRLVDPATAATGQPHESLVEGNIKQSFQAFRDEDHDGVSDD